MTAIAQRTNFQPQHQSNHRSPNKTLELKAPRKAYPNTQQNERQPKQEMKCQLCQKIGHTTDVYCSKSHNHFEDKVNFVSYHHPAINHWILDFGATFHVTTDSYNLEEYEEV